MTVKEKIDKEIALLSPHELMKLHDIILWLHQKKKLRTGTSRMNSPYLKVREALKGIGNLSNEIIQERREIL
jgi:hypothetical protein